MSESVCSSQGTDGSELDKKVMKILLYGKAHSGPRKRRRKKATTKPSSPNSETDTAKEKSPTPTQPIEEQACAQGEDGNKVKAVKDSEEQEEEEEGGGGGGKRKRRGKKKRGKNRKAEDEEEASSVYSRRESRLPLVNLEETASTAALSVLGQDAGTVGDFVQGLVDVCVQRALDHAEEKSVAQHQQQQKQHQKQHRSKVKRPGRPPTHPSTHGVGVGGVGGLSQPHFHMLHPQVPPQVPRAMMVAPTPTMGFNLEETAETGANGFAIPQGFMPDPRQAGYIGFGGFMSPLGPGGEHVPLHMPQLPQTMASGGMFSQYEQLASNERIGFVDPRDYDMFLNGEEERRRANDSWSLEILVQDLAKALPNPDAHHLRKPQFASPHSSSLSSSSVSSDGDSSSPKQSGPQGRSRSWSSLDKSDIFSASFEHYKEMAKKNILRQIYRKYDHDREIRVQRAIIMAETERARRIAEYEKDMLQEKLERARRLEWAIKATEKERHRQTRRDRAFERRVNRTREQWKRWTIQQEEVERNRRIKRGAEADIVLAAQRKKDREMRREAKRKRNEERAERAQAKAEASNGGGTLKEQDRLDVHSDCSSIHSSDSEFSSEFATSSEYSSYSGDSGYDSESGDESASTGAKPSSKKDSSLLSKAKKKPRRRRRRSDGYMPFTDDYEVVCPYTILGCGTTCMRTDLEKHLDECPFRAKSKDIVDTSRSPEYLSMYNPLDLIVDCPYKVAGCSHRCSRAMLPAHLLKCPFQDDDIDASDLAYYSASRDLVDLDSYEIVCPYSVMGCTETMLRSDVSKHFKVCKFAPASRQEEEEAVRARNRKLAIDAAENERQRRLALDSPGDFVKKERSERYKRLLQALIDARLVHRSTKPEFPSEDIGPLERKRSFDLQDDVVIGPDKLNRHRSASAGTEHSFEVPNSESTSTVRRSDSATDLYTQRPASPQPSLSPQHVQILQQSSPQQRPQDQTSPRAQQQQPPLSPVPMYPMSPQAHPSILVGIHPTSGRVETPGSPLPSMSPLPRQISPVGSPSVGMPSFRTGRRQRYSFDGASSDPSAVFVNGLGQLHASVSAPLASRHSDLQHVVNRSAQRGVHHLHHGLPHPHPRSHSHAQPHPPHLFHRHLSQQQQQPPPRHRHSHSLTSLNSFLGAAELSSSDAATANESHTSSANPYLSVDSVYRNREALINSQNAEWIVQAAEIEALRQQVERSALKKKQMQEEGKPDQTALNSKTSNSSGTVSSNSSSSSVVCASTERGVAKVLGPSRGSVNKLEELDTFPVVELKRTQSCPAIRRWEGDRKNSARYSDWSFSSSRKDSAKFSESTYAEIDGESLVGGSVGAVLGEPEERGRTRGNSNESELSFLSLDNHTDAQEMIILGTGRRCRSVSPLFLDSDLLDDSSGKEGSGKSTYTSPRALPTRNAFRLASPDWGIHSHSTQRRRSSRRTVSTADPLAVGPPHAFSLQNHMEEQARNLNKRLHGELVKLADECKRGSEELFASVEQIRERVRRVATYCFGYEVRVDIFGSFATGLAVPDLSDVDLVIFTNEERSELNGAMMCNILGRVMVHAEWVKQMKVLDRAKMPVIKLTTARNATTSGLELNVDLTIAMPSHAGVATVDYVKSLVDQQFQGILLPITVALKKVLAKFNLCDPFTGGLGSYALVLLIVASLNRSMDKEQTRKSLNKLDEAEDVELKDAAAPAVAPPSDSSLGKYLMDVLELYGRDFDPHEEAIVTVLAASTPFPRYTCWVGPRYHSKSAPMTAHHQGPSPVPNPLLVVDDPVQLGNNVGASCFRFIELQHVFADLYARLLSYTVRCKTIESDRTSKHDEGTVLDQLLFTIE